MVPSVWLATPAANFPEIFLTVVLTSSIHEVTVFCSNIRGFCNYFLQDNEYFLLPSAAMQGIQLGVGSGPYTGIPSITQKKPVSEIRPASQGPISLSRSYGHAAHITEGA